MRNLDINVIITIIIIYGFICNDLIGVNYVKEERLHNPCGFVSDIYIYIGCYQLGSIVRWALVYYNKQLHNTLTGLRPLRAILALFRPRVTISTHFEFQPRSVSTRCCHFCSLVEASCILIGRLKNTQFLLGA